MIVRVVVFEVEKVGFKMEKAEFFNESGGLAMVLAKLFFGKVVREEGGLSGKSRVDDSVGKEVVNGLIDLVPSHFLLFKLTTDEREKNNSKDFGLG